MSDRRRQPQGALEEIAGDETDAPPPAHARQPAGAQAEQPAQPQHTLPTSPADSWDRYGWLMGVVWLVFLVFPIYAVLFRPDVQTWARALGLLIIAVFGVVYVRGIVTLNGVHDPAQERRTGTPYVAALIALSAALFPIIGSNALSMLSYIVALTIFTFSARRGPIAVGVLIGVAALIALLEGTLGVAWFVLGISVLVAAICWLSKVLDARSAAQRMLAKDLTLTSERERVARDVHDVLGHSLTVVTIKAELAERLVDVDPPRAKAELAEIRSLSRQALAEVRATVSGLRVARLGEECVAARHALAGVGIEARLPDDAEVVDPRHRIVLAWALREAVTNVVRHSGASRCEVTWGKSWIEISDDGTGRGARREGNGLRGLRERVAAARGTVTFAAGPDGRGTTLRVDLPTTAEDG